MKEGTEIGPPAPLESPGRGGRTAARADPARSPQVLARVFSRAALERYVPRLQGALRREVRSWCAARGPVAVYEAAKALTFRMAACILLGLRLDEAQCAQLAQTFEQFVENLFSLPLDVPFSGLRKVLPPQAQTFPVGAPQRERASQTRTRLPRRASRVKHAAGPRHYPGWGGGVVRLWAPAGLASVLTRCVTWGGSHTLSGPLLTGRAAAAVAAGFPTLGLRGRRPASQPSPSPERRLLAGPPSPLWKPGWLQKGWELWGRRHAPGPARRQPVLERGGCQSPASGLGPAGFRIGEPRRLQTAERRAGPESD